MAALMISPVFPAMINKEVICGQEYTFVRCGNMIYYNITEKSTISVNIDICIDLNIIINSCICVEVVHLFANERLKKLIKFLMKSFLV